MLYLGFRIGDGRYAVRGRDVIQLIPRVTLRPVPLTPAGVAGLFTFRGEVVPAVDLAILLAGRPSNPALSSRIMIVSLEHTERRRTIGLLAERVTEVLQEDATPQVTVAVEPAPYLGDAIVCGGEVVQIIEPARLFSEELWQTLLPCTADA